MVRYYNRCRSIVFLMSQNCAKCLKFHLKLCVIEVRVGCCGGCCEGKGGSLIFGNAISDVNISKDACECISGGVYSPTRPVAGEEGGVLIMLLRLFLYFLSCTTSLFQKEVREGGAVEDAAKVRVCV